MDALRQGSKRHRDPRDKRIKELERELARKEKALAETAALLTLKKKAHLIWGTQRAKGSAAGSAAMYRGGGANGG